MEKPAVVEHPVQEIVRRRWSPRAFSDRPVEPGALRSLLEAARWAPSSYNEQPWAFLVARREEPAEFDRMLGCLVPGNQTWARSAPVLVISVAKQAFDRNGKPNRHAFHDVGAAAAWLTVEATARGLFVHQMAGIDVEKIRETFGVPAGLEPAAGIAIGYLADPAEPAPRVRKPQAEFVFSGGWGQPAGF